MITQPLEAVILAAGCGTRLGSGAPKCLTAVRGRTLLERALDTLGRAGIKRVHVVTGFEADQLAAFLDSRSWAVEIERHWNPRYLEPSWHSLEVARKACRSSMLVVESDLLFGPRVVRLLLDDPRENVVPVGPVRQKRPWLVQHENGELVRWGYDLSDGNELIGLYKLSHASLSALPAHTGEFWDSLLGLNPRLGCCWCDEPWAEIDTPEDRLEAELRWDN